MDWFETGASSTGMQSLDSTRDPVGPWFEPTGTTTVSEVVVIASSIWLYGSGGGGAGDEGGGTHEQTEYPGDYTGAGEPINAAPCTTGTAPSSSQALDATADAKAAEVAREIMGKADWGEREYVAVIYLDASGVVQHGLITGGTRNESYPDAFGISSYGQILGIIHSHTLEEDGSYSNAHFYPSHSNGDGDWFVADDLIRKGTPAATFRHYILAPDGIVREYDFYDRDTETPGRAMDPFLLTCTG